MNEFGNGFLIADPSIKSDNFFESIIALLPGHIYWKDLSLRFLGCNNNQAKMAGLEHRSQIVGLTAYDAISKALKRVN